MKDAHAKLLLAAGAVAVLAYVVKKNGGLGAALAGAVGGAGRALGGAAVAGAEGVVYGVGDALGVPRTDMTECERAIAEGRTWDASFACPAGDFLSSLFADRRPDFGGTVADYIGTYSRPVVVPGRTTIGSNASGTALPYPIPIIR